MAKDRFTHLSDQELLLALDGELAPQQSEEVKQHLAACWTCRVRMQEIEGTIAEFVRCHHRAFPDRIPPADGPRSLLLERMQRYNEQPDPSRNWTQPFRSSWRSIASALAAVAFIAVLLPQWTHPGVVNAVTVTMPDPRLTPGATIVMPLAEVCASENVKNREVSAAMQRKVFEKYGIKDAPPQAYEVDYLITPALGGAEDEHNLWPHSYESTVWNAFVKDQLEDYLRDQVCGGAMDLTTAQQEIAGDWIAAYRKHFHTEEPLKEIPR